MKKMLQKRILWQAGATNVRGLSNDSNQWFISCKWCHSSLRSIGIFAEWEPKLGLISCHAQAKLLSFAKGSSSLATDTTGPVDLWTTYRFVANLIIFWEDMWTACQMLDDQILIFGFYGYQPIISKLEF